jgi:hypothetical protein
MEHTSILSGQTYMLNLHNDNIYDSMELFDCKHEGMRTYLMSPYTLYAISIDPHTFCNQQKWTHQNSPSAKSFSVKERNFWLMQSFD